MSGDVNEMYGERKVEVPWIFADFVEVVHGGVKDVGIVLYSLKKQLEVLRGEMDHLLE